MMIFYSYVKVYQQVTRLGARGRLLWNCTCYSAAAVIWLFLLWLKPPASQQDRLDHQDTRKTKDSKLVGGLEHVSFSHILGTIIPID